MWHSASWSQAQLGQDLEHLDQMDRAEGLHEPPTESSASYELLAWIDEEMDVFTNDRPRTSFVLSIPDDHGVLGLGGAV